MDYVLSCVTKNIQMSLCNVSRTPPPNSTRRNDSSKLKNNVFGMLLYPCLFVMPSLFWG